MRKRLLLAKKREYAGKSIVQHCNTRYTLSKFAKPDYLGEKAGLAIALAFPVLYFVYDWIQRRKVNAISILGFAGILVMGLIGLLELPREYVAYERAAKNPADRIGRT